MHSFEEKNNINSEKKKKIIMNKSKRKNRDCKVRDKVTVSLREIINKKKRYKIRCKTEKQKSIKFVFFVLSL